MLHANTTPALIILFGHHSVVFPSLVLLGGFALSNPHLFCSVHRWPFRFATCSARTFVSCCATMVVTYAVARPRGLQRFSFRRCREWQDDRSPDFTYDYRLFDASGVEVEYWVRQHPVRPYLMVTLSFSQGGRPLMTPLHKLFAYNSPVCNPSNIPWSVVGTAHVHHGGRLTRGRNCREGNLTVKTVAGHRLTHRSSE